MDADRTVGEARIGLRTEYEALTERVAFVDDTDRVIFRVSGDRARDTINGLATNTLEPLAEGRCVYAFMLTAKGRVVAEMRIVPKPASARVTEGPHDAGPWTGEVLLDAPAACADFLLAHLTKYVPPLYARFEATDTARFGIVGPSAPEALEHVESAHGWRIVGARAEDLEELRAIRIGVVREDPAGDAPFAPLLVRREAIEGPGFDVYAPAEAASAARSALREAVESLKGVAASRPAREILRVERGLPAYGHEITDDTLPQETGQTARAISFDKGCYTGQEVVARIHYRGHVNRRLAGFATSDPTTPLVSDSPLFLGERAVAEIRTAVLSPRHGSIALGYARREIDAGAELSRDPGAPANVQVRDLPFTVT